MTAERHALEDERKKLRTEWLVRQQKRIKELEAQFAQMQKRFEENVAGIVATVKERELQSKLEKMARRKFSEARGEAHDDLNAAVVRAVSASQPDLGVTPSTTQPVNPEKLQPGAKVRVRGFSRPVVFRRLDGNSAEIEAGPLRMKVALDEITGVESSSLNTPSAGGTAGVSVRTQPRETLPADEINVIGLTVEEASERVDKFLDDAILAHLPRVRIIHGHGTGALRRGLLTFLKIHPLVKEVRHEVEERGGSAITVVHLSP
jgi:DNA mismatch repair protein MutS2